MAILSLPKTTYGLMLCHLYKAALTVVLTAAAMTALAYDRRPPVVFEAGKVISQTVVPGDTAQIDWIVKVARVCHGGVQRIITGNDGFVHTTKVEPASPPPAPGTYQRESELPIPRGLPSGEATYKVELSFNDCGLTSRWIPIVVSSPTVKVQIASSDSR